MFGEWRRSAKPLMVHSYKKTPTKKRSIRPLIFPIGPSIAYVPLTRGQYALIDSCDAAEIGKNNWHAAWAKNNNSFYARRNIISDLGTKTTVPMHRIIMGLPDGLQVDHIHGNTLDNRRSELRVATNAENCRNRKPHRNSSSGIKGITPHHVEGFWRAQIMVGGKRFYLGVFPSQSEAHAAYCSAAEKHYGEFARVA